jgi:quinoprotein dehydrogenase-associated probable ABC transporter substrate-binding protein
VRRGVFIAVAALAAFGLAQSGAAAQTTGLGAAIELVDPKVLRVCADPNDLPFSNEKGEGYENELAEFIAGKLGREEVTYTFFPQVTGFVRNTLGAHKCDVIMSYPQGDELVQNTNAYYQTAYALVLKPGSDLEGVETLADPRLKGKRIGVVAGTPPATNLAKNGLIGNARPYHLVVDTRFGTSAERMIADLEAGEIDAALLWGPLAGWYAKQAEPDLVVVPLLNEKGGSRMVYRITMGVRPSDQEWKRTLNRVIAENQEEINEILLSYGVPLLDENNQPIRQ